MHIIVLTYFNSFPFSCFVYLYSCMLVRSVCSRSIILPLNVRIGRHYHILPSTIHTFLITAFVCVVGFMPSSSETVHAEHHKKN